MTTASAPFQLGGSSSGSHYIDDFRRCPMMWYRRHLQPHQGGRGLESRFTPVPLMVGWVCHEALDAYYRSGWADGAYSIDSALERGRAAIEFRTDEFEGVDAKAECFAEIERLVRNYDAYYGPRGAFPEYPEYRVAVVDGEPLIEKNLSLPLGSHTFTGRLDTVVEHRGSFYSMEHKTCAASKAHSTFAQLRMGTQGRGQVALLKHNYPDLPVRGIIGNVLVKNAAKGKPNVQREAISFSDIEIEKFTSDAYKTLKQIERAKYQFEETKKPGKDLYNYLDIFPMHTHSCASGYSPCTFTPLCRNLDKSEVMASSFKAKHKGIE